jgi:hypothetical protein
MSYSERNVNNGSAAAALGLAVAVDDIENVGNDTNSHNSTSSDNDIYTKTVSDNDTYTKSDNDVITKSDNDVRDSYNQDNDTITKTINDNDSFTKTVSLSDNDTFTKTINDNDTITKTVSLSDDDVKDSYNQDNDVITKSDDDVRDSYNQDNDVRDSYNQDNDVTDSYNSTDIDTTVDVAISDAFKEITDSYNQDNDWLELDGLDFDVMNVVGEGALAGAGNDAMFNLSQVSELADQDHLYRPSVSNDSSFDVSQHGDGGYAKVDGDLGDRSTATASADGVAQLEAFTQNIVMGANIQYNNVDMSVVGGDSTVTDGGDIS